MCIVGTRCIASAPLDTARTASTTAFPVASFARDLRAFSARAGPARSASALSAAFPTTLSAGTACAAPATIGLIHPAGPTPADLHILLLNGPLDNDAALQ